MDLSTDLPGIKISTRRGGNSSNCTTRPFGGVYVPYTPTIVPTPHVFPSRVVVRVLFHVDRFSTLPPLRASPLECVSQCCQQAHPTALHMGKHSFFCESEQAVYGLCFPSCYSVQDSLTPGPIFASKAKYNKDVPHHSLALHSPRHVFTSVNLHIAPPGFVCILHSFFYAV